MIIVFYYTQSGQALEIAKRICQPLEAAGHEVAWRQIIPLQEYPFPWNKYEFFDSFPEARLGMPPSGIQPIDFSGIEDAELVMIVGQSWFLSPSLPLQSFMENEQVQAYLQGKKVIFVNACRNMWLMTSKMVKAYCHEIKARQVGQIVLQDTAPNLVSALTIVRWLLYGKKQRSGLLPAAGVRKTDVEDASRFGDILKTACEQNNFQHLQAQFLAAGAINYKPSILFLEKAGHRMFGHWAKFIRKRGGFRDPRRRTRVNLFFIYLLVVLFVVSPFAQLFFYLTYPLQRVGKHRREDCNLDYNN